MQLVEQWIQTRHYITRITTERITTRNKIKIITTRITIRNKIKIITNRITINWTSLTRIN